MVASPVPTNPLIYSKDGKNNFGALRLAMAIAVLWSHCFALGLPEGESIEPISLLTNGHYNAGNIAVMVFFVISGFLIGKSYVSSKTTLEFLKKRIRRIYPGYLASIVLCTFIVIPVFASAYDFSARQLVRSVGLNLVLQNYFPPSTVFANNFSQSINGSLWSIPYEFWCYLGIAVLGTIGLLRVSVVAGLIAICISTRVTLDILDKKPGLGLVGELFGWPYLWVFILPCFLIGTLCFQLGNHIRRSRTILLLMIGTFLLMCYAPFGEKFQLVSSEVAFPFTVSYATFYFAFSDGIKLRAIGARADFSYGTYLFAFPIQQMLLSYYGATNINFVAFAASAIVLSLAAGYLSWHLVEKWCLPGRAGR
jgi:peptidoglycan/LPS O-acetylase OafA/YrhL